jgi:hypothetical protein
MSSRTPCHAMPHGMACCVARYPARRSIRAARATVQVLPVLWRPPAPRTLPESGTLIRAWPILPLRSIPMIPLRCMPTRPIPHSRCSSAESSQVLGSTVLHCCNILHCVAPFCSVAGAADAAEPCLRVLPRLRRPRALLPGCARVGRCVSVRACVCVRACSCAWA